MQIVIDIPEEEYIRLRDEGMFGNVTTFKRAVRDGISLPKGHGRLVDADYLRDVILLHNFHGNNKNVVPYSDRKGYRLRQREVDEGIINAPTIIEADKAESEDKE